MSLPLKDGRTVNVTPNQNQYKKNRKLKNLPKENL